MGAVTVVNGSTWPVLGFPDGSAGKGITCNAGDTGDGGLIPGSERSSGEGNGNPLQYSCLENPIDRGAWQATVHGIARVGHNLATKLPPQSLSYFREFNSHYYQKGKIVHLSSQGYGFSSGHVWM